MPSICHPTAGADSPPRPNALRTDQMKDHEVNNPHRTEKAAVPPPFLSNSVMGRRAFLSTLAAGAAATGLAAYGIGAGPRAAAATSSLLSKGGDTTSALPTKVPPGTSLAIASTDNGLNFQLSGLEKDFTFKVSSWVDVSAGPDVLNAFRAGSLDLGSNAGIPPIQAHYQGQPVKIVSVAQSRKPNYIFITAPHSTITSVKDFRGKKLAFSQGQAQGVVLLRALKQAGIPFKDVTLVNLTSDQYLPAVEASQVDVAVVGTSQVPLYLDKYASEGARAIKTNIVDFLSILWAPTSVLQDEAKLAAIAEYVPLAAKAQIWVWTHENEWIQDYYIKEENLTLAQAKEVVALSGKPWIPKTWDKAISWEQETANLLAESGFVKKFDVSGLFDRRFEGLAASAVPSTYWN